MCRLHGVRVYPREWHSPQHVHHTITEHRTLTLAQSSRFSCSPPYSCSFTFLRSLPFMSPVDCDSGNDCYACGYCVNVQNDAVDGTCPSNCNAYRESSSGSSSGDCSAHSECSSVQYCDSNRDCYACSYCVNVFNDAIDGTCPSSCDSARTGSSGGSSSSDSGGSSSSGSCSSTEGTGRDSGGDDCSWYENYQDSCGSYDDSNFRATEMCCACGGGAGSGSSGSSSSGGNSCVSTEGNGRDSGGDSCTWYSGRSSACGNYDDSDFIADQMCCGCSGGAQSASASAAAGPPPPTVSAHPGFCNTEHNGKTNPCDQGDFCCDDDCTICGPRLYCRTFSGQPSPYSECASGPTQRFGFEDRKCEKFVQPDVWCVQRQKAANLAAALEAEEVAYSTFYIAALVLVVLIEVAGLYVVLSTNDELGCMQVLMVLIFGIRSFDMFSDWAFFAITFSKSGSFAMQYTDAGHDFDSLWNTSLAFAILGTLLYFPDLVGFYTRINDGASAKEKKDALWITASVFAFEDFPQLILNGIYLEFTGFDDADPISIFAFVMSLLSLVLNCGLFWSEMGESYEIGPLAPSNGRTHIGVLEGGAGNANAKTDGFGFGVADAADEDDGYLQVDGDVSVGDRVAVEGKGNGVVRFVGPHAAYGTPRIGVELDDPVGKNNGTVKVCGVLRHCHRQTGETYKNNRRTTVSTLCSKEICGYGCPELPRLIRCVHSLLLSSPTCFGRATPTSLATTTTALSFRRTRSPYFRRDRACCPPPQSGPLNPSTPAATVVTTRRTYDS